MIATTTGQALLRVIIDEPADDGLRLIFADWLEDNGDPDRAEFIRVQVESAALEDHQCLLAVPRGPGGQTVPSCRRCDRLFDLQQQGRDLLFGRAGNDLAWRAWLGEGVHIVPKGSRFENHVMFRRGFVHAVRCPLAAWLEHGPALVRSHPVERVEATDRKPFDYSAYGIDPGWRYGWELRPVSWRQDCWGLPAEVWDALCLICRESEDAFMDPAEDPGVWFFRSPEVARDFLSAALLALARGSSS